MLNLSPAQIQPNPSPEITEKQSYQWPHPRYTHLRQIHPHKSLDPILTQRDPRYIRRMFPYLAALSDFYYRAEVEGLENITEHASLIIATHNGGYALPDLYCTMVAFWRRLGIETPGYGLLHEFAFKIPGLRTLLTRLGAVPANEQNARIVLDADFPLLICPGGDVDSLKPFRKRHQIMFGQRRGFIRLALRHRVPIIPMISVGAHETLFILNDGQFLAQITGFSKFLRIKSVPLALGFPFGITPAGIFSIPLPSKIKIQVLKPIYFDEPVTASSDKVIVEKCFEHVRQTMQSALTKLAAQRKHVFFG